MYEATRGATLVEITSYSEQQQLLCIITQLTYLTLSSCTILFGVSLFPKRPQSSCPCRSAHGWLGLQKVHRLCLCEYSAPLTCHLALVRGDITTTGSKPALLVNVPARCTCDADLRGKSSRYPVLCPARTHTYQPQCPNSAPIAVHLFQATVRLATRGHKGCASFGSRSTFLVRRESGGFRAPVFSVWKSQTTSFIAVRSVTPNQLVPWS